MIDHYLKIEFKRSTQERMKPVFKKVRAEIALERFKKNSSYFMNKKKGV